MEIKDSGTRRKFESGAVRDIAEGKGRCDLLPLDAVAYVLGETTADADEVLKALNIYVRNGSIQSILDAITTFLNKRGWDIHTAMLEVAKHYEEGAKKYDERNWEKGISLHCYIDSGVRHYLKYLRGDDDEPHDRAFVWNMLGAIWTHENKPSLIDLPFVRNDEKKTGCIFRCYHSDYDLYYCAKTLKLCEEINPQCMQGE